MPATEQAAKYWNLIEERARQWIRPILTPTPAQNVWQWAAEHVDFSLVPNYDTPLHQRYDPEYLPYWKEPAEG